MTEQGEGQGIVIVGKSRSETGKSYTRKIRKNGLIPANLLSNGKASSLEIESKWLSKAWQNGKTFSLSMDGQNKMVKIHELQIDPVSRNPLHVDLLYC